MDTNNEILDAIEILADKKIGDNITKVLTGICTSVNINKNTCVMDSNGVSGTVYFYGGPPEVNGLYRIFVPSNDMSRSFIIVPPKFTVNPNLLDNWYFGNPVNQRGLTEYTGNGYTVDRWKIDIDTGSGVSINNGLTIKNAGSYIGQYFDRLFDSLDGIPITGSIILSSGHLLTGTLIYKSIINQPQIFFSDSAGGVSMYVNALSNTLTQVELATLKDNVSILAAKLELGSTQTLAHLENGNWVLNEIPVYSDQLARCQRYMLQLVNTIDNYEILGGGAAMNTTQVFAFVSTPVSLFKKPFVLNRTGRFVLVRNTAASDGIPITGIGVDHVSSNGVSLVCTVDTSLDVGEYYGLWCVPNDAPNSLIISANL